MQRGPHRRRRRQEMGDPAAGFRSSCKFSEYSTGHDFIFPSQGTLPFTSANLVDSWAKKKAVVHTPVDDLESFVWVLLYDALAWTPASERTGVERRWWEDINSETLHSLATFKRLLLVVDLGSRAGELEEDLSGSLSIFKPLIQAWFLMANEFDAAHKQLLRKQGDENEFTQLYHDAYKAFISVGLERCATLPDIPIERTVGGERLTRTL